MSSSTLTSQVVVFATAMAAFSGTVLLFAIKTHKSSPSSSQFQSSPVLRPCLSSGERKGDKKKKRVRFAEDVVDPTGDNEDFRRQKSSHRISPQSKQSITASSNFNRGENRGMPANRAALYNGILRDRVIHQRFACSY